MSVVTVWPVFWRCRYRSAWCSRDAPGHSLVGAGLDPPLVGPLGRRPDLIRSAARPFRVGEDEVRATGRGFDASSVRSVEPAVQE